MANLPVFGTSGYLPWDYDSSQEGGPAGRFGIFDYDGVLPTPAPGGFENITNTGGESESTITNILHALRLGSPEQKQLIAKYFPQFVNDPLSFVGQSGIDPRTSQPYADTVYDPTYGYLRAMHKNPDKGLLGAAMPALTFAGLAAGLGGLSGLLGGVSGAAAGSLGGLDALTPFGFEMGLSPSALPGFAGAAGAGAAANGGNIFGLGDFGFLDNPLGGFDLSGFTGDFAPTGFSDGFSTPAEFLAGVGPGTGDLYGAYDLLGAGAGGAAGTGSNLFSNLFSGSGSGAGNILSSLFSSKGLGAGLGALAGLLGGDKQAGTITSITDLPDWQKAFVLSALGDAAKIYDTIPGGVDELTAKSRQYLMDTVGGNYLTNPYEQSVADALGADAAKSVAGQFSSAGRFGSPGMAEATARGVSSAIAPYRYKTYGDERTRQQQAATLAPEFSNAFITQPLLKPSAFMNIVGKPFGKTTSEPYFDNKLSGILGGALLGSRIFS